MERLTAIIATAEMTIIAVVIEENSRTSTKKPSAINVRVKDVPCHLLVDKYAIATAIAGMVDRVTSTTP